MPSWFRHRLARILALSLAAYPLTGLRVGAADAATLPQAPLCTAQATATTTSPGGPAYYLFESNGTVISCGAAPLYGSASGVKPRNPVVAGAATANGSGYWLATSKGDLYPFGNVGSFGSPAHLHLRSPIVAFTPTPDDMGYWFVTAKGNLFHYGDAGFYGSTVRDVRDGDVVALLSTPDGKGYWIISTKGVVRNFGDAPSLGSLAHKRPAVIASTANPDGLGLVILTKDGGVHNLGASAFYGSLVHHRLSRPLTTITSTPDGAGYLLASASGNVFNFGDASFEGSLAGAPPRRPTAVVALSEVTLPTPPVLSSVPASSAAMAAPAAPTALLPHGAFGYDVSNFQCSATGSSSASSTLPSSSPFSVIEVAGWLDSSDNSCLGAEAAWATAAEGATGTHYSLYLFMNAPDQSAGATLLDATGPAGTCSTVALSAQPGCFAYNYGYEGAASALSYATSVGVGSSLWWLDVEGANLSSTAWSDFSAGEYWSSSTILNDDTIQGALDALHSAGATVGLYSSSAQFATIAGPFVPSGAPVPLWVAGAPWTSPPYTESGLSAPSVLAGWCAGTATYANPSSNEVFAGGVPWLLQETPGSEVSPYGISPDYAC